MIPADQMEDIRASDMGWGTTCQLAPESVQHRRLLLSELDTIDAQVATIAGLFGVDPTLDAIEEAARTIKSAMDQHNQVARELHTPFVQAAEAPTGWTCMWGNPHKIGEHCDGHCARPGL